MRQVSNHRSYTNYPVPQGPQRKTLAVPCPPDGMAPPPEFVEVRCAGCSETLEVEPGLTEFACPDCGTHQALPPELMPRRPRRALPIPGRGPTAAVPVPVPVPVPARMPCGGCSALLGVPAGLGRFACPLCGVGLAVDGERLRLHLASKPGASVSIVAPLPAGATLTSPYTRWRQEVQVERYDDPIRSEETAAQCRSLSVRSEHMQEQYPVVGIASHRKQRNDLSATREQQNTDPLNEASNVEQAQVEYQSKTTGWNPKRKRSSKSTSGNNKKKSKGLRRYQNDGLHLRRSKRFTRQSEHPINDDPAQQSAASSNKFDSNSPDIDKIIANQCPSLLHRHQMAQASSGESDNVDAAILLASSNHGMPQVEKSPRCYSQFYPPEVSGTHQLDKSGEQMQPQSPEVMHMQQEDAHGGHRLSGSDGKSAGKRRGRPQNRLTRLIEPRREADRPILIPNNIDNWDVNPPCPKVASTITVLMKQKHPGSTYLPVGQHGNVPPDGEVVHHWHQYPPETRAAILNEFLQRYKWTPGREAECLKLFERRAVRQFAGILWQEKRRARAELASVHKSKETSGTHSSNRCTELNNEDAREEREDQQVESSEDDDPLQWKFLPPAWMHLNWWEMLCEHWAKEEVLMMSSQNRKNRCAGGHAFHTTGSRSFAMHRQLMVMENGGELVSELEVFNKTHKLNGGTGEFISERAKRTVEGFMKRMEEAGDKQIDPNLAWAQEVGGRSRHGRYYGLTGIIDKAKVNELAKSIPGCFARRGQKQNFTQEQVQQMINQALQRLNETWEDKFKSLEQSVHGVPLLGVHPEHVPGSPAAGRGVQEDHSTHQDALDSQHGDRSPSARHDNNDDDEEVVSTSI